jgi:hypothetical protein
LIEHDRARECRRVGGFLLGSLGRVELACIDRKADREEESQHHDREQNNSLAFLAIVTSEEPIESVHL